MILSVAARRAGSGVRRCAFLCQSPRLIGVQYSSQASSSSPLNNALVFHDHHDHEDDIQSYDKIPDDLRDLVDEYCQWKQTPVSMHTLVKTGRQELLSQQSYEVEAIKGTLNQQNASGGVLIQAANFLRNELPVRLAHRIHDLDNVPMMRDMPSVQLVKGIYINSFVDLVRYGNISNNEDEAAFAHFLNERFEMHSNVLIQMARGAYELRQQKENASSQIKFSQLQECHEFLDRFYTSRIGIRVLAGQYLALRKEPLPGYIGMICLKTSPYEIVRQAARDATSMCEKRYGQAPQVKINGRLDLTFPYIPTYLHYMLLELLKNAMRATVERHGNNSGKPIPPVQVIIADERDNEDVVIKVADVGGGIPRSDMKKIWSYLFTTADPKIQEDFIGDKDHDTDSSPLAGLGFGLPISRSYARYFNGDLNIMSMEGWGTDAYLHLARLEDPNQEFS